MLFYYRFLNKNFLRSKCFNNLGVFALVTLIGSNRDSPTKFTHKPNVILFLIFLKPLKCLEDIFELVKV